MHSGGIGTGPRQSASLTALPRLVERVRAVNLRTELIQAVPSNCRSLLSPNHRIIDVGSMSYMRSL